MNIDRLSLILALTLALASGLATAATQEPSSEPGMKQLVEENRQLKQQLEEARRQCSTVTAAQPQSNAGSAESATEMAAPSSTAHANQATASRNANPPIPDGYKLVKVEPTEPYSETGCPKYRGSRDTRWQQRENWDDLARGQSMHDVENLLGVEHYDVSDHRRVGWQYGKCGLKVKGTVVFEGGVVVFWQPPYF